MQFIEEAKKRRAELQRELAAIDKFLAFYAEEANEPLSPEMTLSQLSAAKLASVRLINVLHHSSDFGGRKPEEITLGQIHGAFGFPISDEAGRRFLMQPNAGRKALNELRDLLSRVQQPSRDSGPA
jgi:hypothetical protein